jgi:hypothetical protein
MVTGLEGVQYRANCKRVLATQLINFYVFFQSVVNTLCLLCKKVANTFWAPSHKFLWKFPPH